MNGYVQTPYGPMPGCAECGVVPLGKAHVCEHGVTPALTATVEFTVECDADLLRFTHPVAK